MNQAPPIIAFTPGEPAGIGPDLAVGLASQDLPLRLIVVADADMLQQRAVALGIDLAIHRDPDRIPEHRSGNLSVCHVPLNSPAEIGRLDTKNATAVLRGLELSVRECVSGRWHAMTTGPVHKAIINEAGIAFSGHTEFLARLTDTELPVMMLASESLKVALVTTHLPLSEVPGAISGDRIIRTLEVLEGDLRHRFGIASPRILVCGLNPHAGEGGHLGREEIEIIEPALDEARYRGILVDGPLPADTLFTPRHLSGATAVLAMYHDQGLPVLKYSGFGQAVNVTLGLPIIRTSVDHGTATELAGTGRADPGSLLQALGLAATLAKVEHS